VPYSEEMLTDDQSHPTASDPTKQSPASVPSIGSSDKTGVQLSHNPDELLVQYIVMRQDLIKSKSWSVGGLIANGSHACIAAISLYLTDPDVQSYLRSAVSSDPRDQMHKVVLAAKDEMELKRTADLLESNEIKYKLWVEFPENYPSCLATKPYPRRIIQPLLKQLKLFR